MGFFWVKERLNKIMKITLVVIVAETAVLFEPFTEYLIKEYYLKLLLQSKCLSVLALRLTIVQAVPQLRQPDPFS